MKIKQLIKESAYSLMDRGMFAAWYLKALKSKDPLLDKVEDVLRGGKNSHSHHDKSHEAGDSGLKLFKYSEEETIQYVSDLIDKEGKTNNQPGAILSAEEVSEWFEFLRWENHNSAAFRYYEAARTFLGEISGERAVPDNYNEMYGTLSNEEKKVFFEIVTSSVVPDLPQWKTDQLKRWETEREEEAKRVAGKKVKIPVFTKKITNIKMLVDEFLSIVNSELRPLCIEADKTNNDLHVSDSCDQLDLTMQEVELQFGSVLDILGEMK